MEYLLIIIAIKIFILYFIKPLLYIYTNKNDDTYVYMWGCINLGTHSSIFIGAADP